MKTKSLKGIARRNLHIIATFSLVISIAALAFSARQFVQGPLPMPDKITPEIYQSLREASSISIFGVIPMFGCCFLAITICIWLEIRRLSKSDSEPAGADVNRKS
jgi:ribose/xylose/arabinose/galactoside ABC-type transport system permease subunit